MNIEVEKIVKYSLYLLYLLIPLTVIFLWNTELDYKSTVDGAKFGTYGDFVGGVLGAIWSLCGVLIFYSALKEQRLDIQINRNALEKQIEALNLQIEEFKLQREEMSQSRQVFIEQSKTLKQQRMASTYFSLLEVYQKIVDGLNKRCAQQNYFRTFKEEFINRYGSQDTYNESRSVANSIFSDIYHEKKEDLSQYFKIVYRILKVVDKSDLDEINKFEFITIFRSQLGENEMFALYYNSHSKHGESLYKYILRFNLLKHLPCLSKVEFRAFEKNSKSSSKLVAIEQDLTRLIADCLDTLSRDIINDNFQYSRVSAFLSYDNSVILSATSGELNEISIELSSPTIAHSISNIFESVDEFITYVSYALYDIFMCSRYIERIEFSEFVTTENTNDKIVFNIRSTKKLGLNSDTEGAF
ncbi:putative phage abortive infection protein [Pseudomonas viridiflava]|uniref:putative phage abortive infection protein n=1 Tax=Pseudomonas viridiflava TaxID=33069 RepID=UPI002B1E5F1B|nr:putative phage abortive infection protein [Pseudomonas viridiflava]